MVNQITNNHIINKQNEISATTSIPSDWVQGKILEGKVISNENNIAVVEIEGIQLQLNSNNQLGGTGSNCRFLIENTSKDEISLKPYEQEKTVARSVKQYDKVQSLLKREAIPISEKNIALAQEMLDHNLEIDKEIFEKVNATKQKIQQMIHTMTKREARELLESPYDLDKISIDVISRFLFTDRVIKETVTEEDVEAGMKQYLHDEEKVIQSVEDIVKVLLEQQLPITRKNVDSLIGIGEKFKAVKHMDDRAISQMVRKGLPHTLNNLYASIFSSGEETVPQEAKQPYENVGLPLENTGYTVTEEEIETFLKQNQIPVDQPHIEAARILIENHMEVDLETIEAMISLKKAIEDLDINVLLDRAAQRIKENKNPGTVEIGTTISYTKDPLTEDNLKELVGQIQNIDDEIIKRILRRNLPMNLRNLQRVMEHEESQNESQEGAVKENDPNFITAKRQLEEIRLKMTLEAASKLNQKIEIDTVSLKELVNELKNLEKEYYRDCLKSAGAEPSSENIEQLEDLYKKIEVVKDLDEGVLPKVIRKEIAFIIDDLYKEQIGEEVGDILKTEAALSRYEEMETKPNPKLGDVIRKVEDQIESLLIEQEIQLTKENIRCARILIQNNIEVTEENIIHLKWLDEQVNYVHANLHPTIAIEMIKEGFRPDQIPMDQVIDYIKEFEGLFGENIRDRLNEFILQIDEEKSLTKEQREGMIGIYRMLHTIERSNGRVIGWLVKNNMPFTLNNLMEGAKYLGRTNGSRQDVDVSVDDKFGVIEERIFPEKSIRTQLENAFKGEMKANYFERIFEGFMESASPSQLKQWLNHPDLQEMNLEEIYHEFIKESSLEQSSVTEEKVKELLKDIGDLKNVDQETLVFMEKNQIPITLRNLQILSSFIENPFLLGENLEGFHEVLKELDMEEDMQKAIREAGLELKKEKEIDEVLDEVKEKVRVGKEEVLYSSLSQKRNGWKMGTDIETMIDIQKQVQNREGTYQIPIFINGKITNMNIYLLKDRESQSQIKKEEFSAFVSMETENLGAIKIYIHMNEKNIDFKISGENQEITQYLKTQEASLQNSIENIGYKIIKSQIDEDLKVASIQNSDITMKRKYVDSDFETII